MLVAQTPCEYARERHQSIAHWRNLWSILLFVFGTAVVVFLVMAVFLFLKEVWLPGALSTLSTLSNGLAMKWVLARRNESVKEEEAAYREVVERCKDTWGPGIEQEIDQERARLNLIGEYR